MIFFKTNLILYYIKREMSKVKFFAEFVSDTKYNSKMFRIMELPKKYKNNKLLLSKLKEYEGEQYIYIRENKIATNIERNIKYKVLLLLDEFNNGKDDIIYIKETLFIEKERITPKKVELTDSDTD